MGDVRPIVEVQLDAPDVDGRISRGYHHSGRTWEFDTKLSGVQQPTWEHHGTEYLPDLKAVGPIGLVAWADMDLEDWNIVDGVGCWEAARPDLMTPRVECLHYTRTDAGETGEVYSDATYPPALAINMIRLQPPDDEGVQPTPWMEIHLRGDGEGRYYALRIPPVQAGNTLSYDNPLAPALYYYSGGSAVQISRADHYLLLTSAQAPVVREQVLIEQIGDDWLRLRVSGVAEPWLVNTEGYPLTRGPVGVRFVGGAGIFAIAPMEWVISSTAPYVEPRQYQHLPTWVQFADTAYYPVALEPEDDAEELGGANVTVTEISVPELRYTKPRVSFVMNLTQPPDTRPLAFRVQQIAGPTLTAPEADPVSVYPERVRWSRNNRWRGAWFEMELRDFDQATAIRPNGMAELWLGMDATEAPVPAAPRIRGYLDGARRRREGKAFLGAPTTRLRAQDHPAARLQGRKYMRHCPSFEEWTARDVFTQILMNSGVAEERIHVWLEVGDEYVLPAGDPPWERAWGYGHDMEVIRALDEMVEHWGLQWGWDESGYFLRPRPEWTPGGVADWTIEYDDEVGENVVTVLDVERSCADYRNFVMTISRDASRVGVVVARPDALDDPEDRFYIGDDAWEMVGSAGTSEEMIEEAGRRLAELERYAVLIEVQSTDIHHAPDEFVAVSAGVEEFVDGSVFRILEENGEAGGLENTTRMRYLMGIEEFAEEEEPGEPE